MTIYRKITVPNKFYFTCISRYKNITNCALVTGIVYGAGTLFKDLPKGSSIIFDIADERLFTETGIFNRVQNMVQMAAASGEPMQFCSSIAQLEQLLAQQDLLIFEHLAPQDIQNRHFVDREDDLQAFETIHYIHAVKK
ncbi:hypothetical protein DCE79_05860 [Lysinibacillus sp. 2017]|uniref:hypothetical protein n=1 Tax=unclassified Lysinibacillus TaxID=2636778 RepID=UPI000D527539|nr:hypothetical protein DCE79_05860 [Lysinibacillus sp. 2017]TGN37121.1 hypothetical protein E4L99_01145 [Lysinibacillus sp. S2017]